MAGRMRRTLRWLAVLGVVGALVAGLTVAWQEGMLDDYLGISEDQPSASGTPSAESGVIGVTPPEAAAPAELAPAAPTSGVAVLPRRARSAVAEAATDPALGRHVVVRVAALDASGPTYSLGEGSVIPASTTKLLTATAALSALGPDHTFTTSVVAADAKRDIVLVGGGDPYLARRPTPADEGDSVYPARADLGTLAAQTARALREADLRRVRLFYDASLFSGPELNPKWEADYGPDDVVAPVTALWVDEGRPASGYGRVDNPSRHAAEVFAAALRKRGIRVTAAPRPGVAPSGATSLASVSSAPLDQIVQHVLDVSDNEGAEVLAHQVGLAVAGDGSFRGGVRGVEETLRKLGVPLDDARIYDGSGLSRHNRLDPAVLTAILSLAADPDHPELRPVLTGLPVAGFTGSLSYRFETGGEAGRGVVRAKTGTLSGVSGLAGMVTDRAGRPLVFVAMADRIALRNTLGARAALDRIAGALADCACTRVAH
ncbi:MAG: D-alanyl-D-alanine carboxypeptidase/D-alanyl-D-alanine-endopeptidase [Nocardioides sp.]|uniref:D-alanyl-D-alanine carboxypeptidase/D-alanyl-D-alanine endopeptidase n=1 Tax=Nocardioides sp. TaxID=35761 RepID=UPI0039E65171